MIARFSAIFSIIFVGIAWAKQPNVLILYADDLGFGDLGCYNKKSRIPTPNLDRLASESVRFTDGHSSSGICTPSRFAMLTGRHHWRDFHGIVNAFGGSVFKPERLTLPEMLKEKGYKTAAIGKWHLGWNWDAIRNKEVRAITQCKRRRRKKQQLGPEAFDWTKSIPNGPLDHGFDYYFGDTVINFPPYCWIENDKVVKAPDTLMQTGKWKKIKEGGWECRPGPMVTGWDPYENIPTTTKKGVEYIKKAAEAEEPFFLYFAYPAPHAPIIPNDEFDGKSKAGPYGDFVYETDHSIGQLLQALKDSGQAENTIVIFSADNGPEHYAYARDAKFDHWSAHPFRGLKRDAYEGGHHVPFMIKYPGVTMAGTVNDALVSQIDIMATLASVVGYDLPEKNAAEDSHDLLPLLKGEVKSIRTSHIHNTFDHTWAFREGDWVLVTGKSGHHSRVTKEWLKKHDYPKVESKQPRLFNLREDIGQRNDLAAKHPEKVKAMETSLARIRAQGYSAPRLRK
jgi:arylsulfatase A